MRSLVLALLLSGCSGMEARALVHYPGVGEEVATSEVVLTHTDAYCQSLLSKQRLFGALGAGSAFAGGSTGIIAAFPATGDARLGVGVASLAAGAGGAVMIYLAGSYAADFGRYCTTAPVGH